MIELERTIGYTFKNSELLTTALTHSSYVNESKDSNCQCNERLEFLGDSVLGFITAQKLYSEYSRFDEGDSSKIRAALVCEMSLAKYARQISLGEYMRFSRSEINSNGKNRDSAIGDAFEALIAAIYLDGGLDEAKRFVLPFIEANMDAAISGKLFKDFKTTLQEIVQKNKGEHLEYVLLKAEGPDHCRKFSVAVMLNSNCIGEGVGNSKKEAEQHAAEQALKLMGL